jgi:hypothetical protein
MSTSETNTNGWKSKVSNGDGFKFKVGGLVVV